MALMTINPPVFNSFVSRLMGAAMKLWAWLNTQASGHRSIPDLTWLSDQQLADIGLRRLRQSGPLRDRYCRF